MWAASALVGITVASVLFCSHFHQIEGDAAAGKMSLLVRLGPERGLQVGCALCAHDIAGGMTDVWQRGG